jgi:Rrf2 family protein
MSSHTSKYVLKAYMTLARKFGQRPVLISDIAQRELIPRKFLKLILLELRHTAILQSRKGKGGGYFLAWEPARFTLGEILRVVEDSLVSIPCVSKTAYMRCREYRDKNNCGIGMVNERSTRCYRPNRGFFHVG